MGRVRPNEKVLLIRVGAKDHMKFRLLTIKKQTSMTEAINVLVRALVSGRLTWDQFLEYAGGEHGGQHSVEEKPEVGSGIEGQG